MHWFGCHTHRSKTYGAPCSIWMVPKLQVFKSSDAPYDFGRRLCIHFFLVQKIDKIVRMITMANHKMQNSFNLQSKWYTGIALAFRIKVKVTYCFFWICLSSSYIFPFVYTFMPAGSLRCSTCRLSVFPPLLLFGTGLIFGSIYLALSVH